MQPHGTRPPALRPPDEQRARISGVVEIAPLKLEDLRNTQTGAPHDERRGARLVPAVDRQRVQQAMDLVGREVMRDIHAWQGTPDELCQIRPCCHPVPPNDRRTRRPKVADLCAKSAIQDSHGPKLTIRGFWGVAPDDLPSTQMPNDCLICPKSYP